MERDTTLKITRDTHNTIREISGLDGGVSYKEVVERAIWHYYSRQTLLKGNEAFAAQRQAQLQEDETSQIENEDLI